VVAGTDHHYASFARPIDIFHAKLSGRTLYLYAFLVSSTEGDILHMTFAIILAGGEGTRFWPLSRQSEPKQFLKVYSDKPMIEETIRRFIRLLPQKNIYLASSFVHEKKIREYARKLKLSSNNILLEPSPKNTLPPIAVISKIIHDISKEAVIIVAPSDHFVKDQSEFLRAIRMAVAVAARGYIVTLGITPRRPETGYGYIKVKTKPKTNAEIGSGVYLIDRFIEKPILSKAKKFVKEGN